MNESGVDILSNSMLESLFVKMSNFSFNVE